MSFPMNIAIASATRTAVGRAIKGTLRHTRPEDLGAYVLQEAVRRVPGLKAEQVEDVILGCAMPEAEQGLNIARNVVLKAGFPDNVPGQTINRFCSSGLQAIALGAQAIATGSVQVVAAGGVECASFVPMSGNKVNLNADLVENRPEVYISMGHTAERVAKRFGVSRETQDEFATHSHQKACAAIAAGRFKDEIVGVAARQFVNGQISSIHFDTDECPRPDTNLAALAKLKPAFSQDGTVTAGNASPMNDGAACVMLLSQPMVEELGIKPLGYFRAFVSVGVAPDIMGIGPVPAIQKLLKQTGLRIEDIDLFEINEAFAAQAAYCQRELGIAADRLNVNGGAIALGHPLGCTGAKLTTSILYELQRRLVKSKGRKELYGVVSMCIGGGMGAAGLVSCHT